MTTYMQVPPVLGEAPIHLVFFVLQGIHATNAGVEACAYLCSSGDSKGAGLGGRDTL